MLLLWSGIYFMMTSVWRLGQNILDHSHSTIQARKMERRSTKIKPALYSIFCFTWKYVTILVGSNFRFTQTLNNRQCPSKHLDTLITWVYVHFTYLIMRSYIKKVLTYSHLLKKNLQDMERICFHDTTSGGHWCFTGLSTRTIFVLHLHQIKVKITICNRFLIFT